MKNKYSHVRGIALIEMVGAMVLLAAFSIIFAELYNATNHIAQQAKARPPADRVWALTQKAIRGDVWGGLEVKVEDEKTVLIRHAGLRAVRWRILANGTGLERETLLDKKSQETTPYPLKIAPARFEPLAGGAALRWPVTDPPTGEADAFFFSQLLLLQGGGK